jgi:hypothetical protein
MAYNTKKMGRREKGIKRKRVLNLKKNNRKGINLNKHHGANKEMLLKNRRRPYHLPPKPSRGNLQECKPTKTRFKILKESGPFEKCWNADL